MRRLAALLICGVMSAAWATMSMPVAGQPRQKGADRPVVTVRPLHTGVCQIGKDHVLGEPYSRNERMAFVIYAFLVEGSDGSKAMIDLGPKSVDYCNRMFRRFGFFRDLGENAPAEQRYPDDIRQPHGNALDQLKAIGVGADQIGHVVFSHLHADHHGMHNARDGGLAEDFPRATLHLSARGWQANIDARTDGWWNSYVDYAFGDFVLSRQAAGKVRLADDAAVMPGMRTLYLGGHSPCSQAIIMDTADGPVIFASDEVYLYQLIEDDITPRIRTSERQYREAVDRLVQAAVGLNGVIVPSHDPAVWAAYEKSGARWVAELRGRSEAAVKRYLAKRATGRP